MLIQNLLKLALRYSKFVIFQKKHVSTVHLSTLRYDIPILCFAVCNTSLKKALVPFIHRQ